jgi:hypothetical protein
MSNIYGSVPGSLIRQSNFFDNEFKKIADKYGQEESSSTEDQNINKNSSNNISKRAEKKAEQKKILSNPLGYENFYNFKEPRKSMDKNPFISDAVNHVAENGYSSDESENNYAEKTESGIGLSLKQKKLSEENRRKEDEEFLRDLEVANPELALRYKSKFETSDESTKNRKSIYQIDTNSAVQIDNNSINLTSLKKIVSDNSNNTGKSIHYSEDQKFHVTPKLTAKNWILQLWQRHKSRQAGRDKVIQVLNDSFGETATSSALRALGLHKRGSISLVQADRLVAIAKSRNEILQSDKITYGQLLEIIGKKSNSNISIIAQAEVQQIHDNNDKHSLPEERNGLDRAYAACVNSFGERYAIRAFHELKLQAGTGDRVGQKSGYDDFLTSEEVHELAKVVNKIKLLSPFEKYESLYGTETASYVFNYLNIKQVAKNIDENTLKHIEYNCERYSQYQPQA